VRRERGDLVRAPYPQRHRGQDRFQLAVVSGGEKAEGTPFARPQRRPPQAQQVPLRRELPRAGGLAGADVRDRLVWRSVRNVGGHRDEIFHDERIPGSVAGTTYSSREKICRKNRKTFRMSRKIDAASKGAELMSRERRIRWKSNIV
jgi:hypothetical protein